MKVAKNIRAKQMKSIMLEIEPDELKEKYYKMNE